MKRLIVLTVACLLALAGTAQARFYVPRHGHACRAHYVRKTVRVHGHRQVRCVYVAPKTSAPAPAPTIPAPTTPAPGVPAPVSVRAGIDPSYTQDAADNLHVTWDFSASAATSLLPAGTLTLTIYEHGKVGAAGGCTINVAAAQTGGTCTTELPEYGTYDITVTYTGNDPTVAPSSSTDTETIEPVPATVQETWGQTPPTQAPQVSANVVGSTASVTVSDQDFEGAKQIGVTDNLGDTCQATVSGQQAACQMPVAGTPSSFTLAYPGGATQQSTRQVPPNGIQTVSYTWGADSVPVSHPSVTVQQAPVTWDGCSVNGHNCGPTPSNPLDVNVGQQVNLYAYAAGSLASDPNPQGWITFTVRNDNGGTWTESNEQAGPGDSIDCSVSSNMAGQAVGGCSYDFQSIGTYIVTPSFHSSTADYPNGVGPSLTVQVS